MFMAKRSEFMSINNLKLGKIIAMTFLFALISCSSVKNVQVTPESQKVLSSLLKAREDAVKAGANLKMDDFKDANEDLAEIVVDVNNGEIKDTEEERREVEAEFRKVELRLIKERNLTGVKAKLKVLLDKDVNESAPKSISAAKTAISIAEKTIEANRYDIALISKKVEEALFLVDRAGAIAIQVNSVDKESAEDTLIREEKVLGKIRTASKGVILDSRNKPIADQATDVAMFVETSIKVGKSISDQKKNLKNEVATKEDMIKNKENELQKLAKQEEIVNKIRSIFTAGEADVFIQDGKVVVRLVGLGFKVGSSAVEESNQELLGKMQTLVETTQAESLAVEGHSDSMGPAIINDKLSTERALAIKNYLVTNQVLAEDKIKAEGFGANRPIATNDNWQGRRKNRRIDIIMEL
jgi:outer membrane protein OmpA-like peptidoglycan-associated protein